jgi:hypothetical protein
MSKESKIKETASAAVEKTKDAGKYVADKSKAAYTATKDKASEIMVKLGRDVF